MQIKQALRRTINNSPREIIISGVGCHVSMDCSGQVLFFVYSYMVAQLFHLYRINGYETSHLENIMRLGNVSKVAIGWQVQRNVLYRFPYLYYIRYRWVFFWLNTLLINGAIIGTDVNWNISQSLMCIIKHSQEQVMQTRFRRKL